LCQVWSNFGAETVFIHPEIERRIPQPDKPWDDTGKALLIGAHLRIQGQVFQRAAKGIRLCVLNEALCLHDSGGAVIPEDMDALR